MVLKNIISRLKRTSLKIAVIYGVFGGIWILFSDRILAFLVRDPALITKIQTYKGWFYVFVTAVLVYILVRRMEKKLLGYIREIAAKNEELESIIYVSSHDLRAPLINIQGFTNELVLSCDRINEILKEPHSIHQNELDSILQEMPETVKFITSSTAKLDNLQQSLLQFCRLGKAPMNPAQINMNTMLSQIVDTMSFQCNELNAKIVLSELHDCYGDNSQINQVFTNLLDNALKYLKPGTDGLIEVSAEQNRTHCIYCVSDNGIGIRPQYCKKIFELFHRLNPSDQASGEGIGLTIIKRILQRHNGDIRVESEPQKGSRFYISLPRNADAMSTNPQ